MKLARAENTDMDLYSVCNGVTFTWSLKLVLPSSAANTTAKILFIMMESEEMQDSWFTKLMNAAAAASNTNQVRTYKTKRWKQA